MIGPLFLYISKSILIAVNGVRTSENIKTPTGRKAYHGCSEIWTIRSVGRTSI